MLACLSAVLGLVAVGTAIPIDTPSISLASLQKRDVCATTSSANVGTFSQPCSTYTSAVTCPNGIKGAAGGVVLLVHGTGSTGYESWGNGPWSVLLPTAGPGFDICWIDLPERSLNDAQATSEWVAYNIYDLAQKSATGKVSLVSHSQGGPNVQWALDFWAAYRPLVSTFVALAPDFHGSMEGPLACAAGDLTVGGCNPSDIQQSAGSHYVAALSTNGSGAFVPTTVVYTLDDEIIQPEIGSGFTSRLAGASVHAVQDLDLCGPGYIADHFIMIVSSVAYELGVDALTHGGVPDTSRVDKAACFSALHDFLPFDNFNRTAAHLQATFNDIKSNSEGPQAQVEPLLKPYVCASGAATAYCATA